MWFQSKPEVQDVETKVVKRINAELTEFERKLERIIVRLDVIELRNQKFEGRFYKHVADESKEDEDEETDSKPLKPKSLKAFTGMNII